MRKFPKPSVSCEGCGVKQGCQWRRIDGWVALLCSDCHETAEAVSAIREAGQSR
jgi:hypothetical protein